MGFPVLARAKVLLLRDILVADAQVGSSSPEATGLLIDSFGSRRISLVYLVRYTRSFLLFSLLLQLQLLLLFPPFSSFPPFFSFLLLLLLASAPAYLLLLP